MYIFVISLQNATGNVEEQSSTGEGTGTATETQEPMDTTEVWELY